MRSFFIQGLAMLLTGAILVVLLPVLLHLFFQLGPVGFLVVLFLFFFIGAVFS